MNEGLVLFDGVCNFCNYWVQFAIKRNKKKNLRFGSLQGNTAQEILPRYQIDPSILKSVVFIENNTAYQSSTAVLKICKHLDGGWKLLSLFLIIPSFLRDPVYNWIGKNRYKWFGKKESCMIPTAEQRALFVD